MKTVAVYCGSSPRNLPLYLEAATQLGKTLAAHDLTLVYGGGRVGLMGAVADAVLSSGGNVIGVMPDFLVAKEVAHKGLSEFYTVPTMHERKAKMADLADAFIMLPGGYGTLEEFTETLTWAQLGLHQKPMGVLNVAGYYDKLLEFFDGMVTAGFLGQKLRDLVLEATTPETLLKRLSSHTAPGVDEWNRVRI